MPALGLAISLAAEELPPAPVTGDGAITDEAGNAITDESSTPITDT